MSYEPSLAQFKGILGPSICAFDESNSNIINVITSRGLLLELRFELKMGGEPIEVKTANFLTNA